MAVQTFGANVEIDRAQIVSACEVVGDPIPWSRAGHGRLGQSYTPQRYREHRDLIAYGLRDGRRRGARHPLAVDLGIWATFVRRTRRRVDIDNLLKCVLDAGTGIVWGDDAQITLALCRIVIDPELPRTELVVFRRELPEHEVQT